MRKEKPKYKQKQVLFEDIVKVSKVNLQNNQKSIDKQRSNKLKLKINLINPQQNKSLVKDKQVIQSPRESLPSSNHNHYQKPKNISSQDQFQQIREENILKQKAKNLILKLRKQKEYNKGRLMILRKKEEQRKQQKQKQLEEEAIKYFQFYNIQKMQQMVNNIILHRSRIDYRQRRSQQKERISPIRSKTQCKNQKEELRYEQKKQILEFPSINQSKKRLSNYLYLIQNQNQ